MTIRLGGYTFGSSRVSLIETYEEVGGRDGRIIQLKGLFEGFVSLEALEAEFDSMISAASGTEEVALSLRPGRRLWGRRTAFTREINREALVGAFSLRLEAQDAFEEAIEAIVTPWSIARSGAVITIATGGNASAFPIVSVVACGNVMGVEIGDGTRAIRYPGMAGDGQVLVFDAAAGRVMLDGEDVTPYAEGVFPLLAPPETVLNFRDDEDSSHTASATVAHRARWW